MLSAKMTAIPFPSHTWRRLLSTIANGSLLLQYDRGCSIHFSLGCGTISTIEACLQGINEGAAHVPAQGRWWHAFDRGNCPLVVGCSRIEQQQDVTDSSTVGTCNLRGMTMTTMARMTIADDNGHLRESSRDWKASIVIGIAR
jgi:hypothetical protein